jgi:hypothetical protein
VPIKRLLKKPGNLQLHACLPIGRDYETITPIRSPLKIKKNLWNHLFAICVIKRAKSGFSELSKKHLSKR